MAEYIEKAKALMIIDEVHGARRAYHRVQNIPAADVAPVVRCKDCKRCTNTSNGIFCDHSLPTKRLEEVIFYGTTVLARVKPNDFCSYGERKDGDCNG